MARQAYEDYPTNGEALHMMPNQYDHENGWIGMYQQGEAFVELEPHKFENLAGLAAHYRMTGLVYLALEVARRHVELNPFSVDALKNLAGLEHYHGDLEVAAELFDRMAAFG
jgi:hypothetical protein